MRDRPTPETDALAEKLIPIAEKITEFNAQSVVKQLLTDILTKTTELERERDEAREVLRTLAEHGENEIQKLIKQRDEAREEWGKASMDAAQLLSEKTKIMAERDQLKEALLIMENLLKPGIELFPELGEILKGGVK